MVVGSGTEASWVLTARSTGSLATHGDPKEHSAEHSRQISECQGYGNKTGESRICMPHAFLVHEIQIAPFSRLPKSYPTCNLRNLRLRVFCEWCRKRMRCGHGKLVTHVLNFILEHFGNCQTYSFFSFYPSIYGRIRLFICPEVQILGSLPEGCNKWYGNLSSINLIWFHKHVDGGLKLLSFDLTKETFRTTTGKFLHYCSKAWSFCNL